MQRKILIISIILLAVGLRTWNLSASDITPDEHHYIHDAEGLWHHDPFISIRHHPFFHGKPNMGHPFLGQIATATAFNIFGSSIFTARLTSALSGVLIVCLLMSFGRLHWKINMLAAAIYTILPLALRFNRSAYLDSLLSLWTFTAGWAIWKYHAQKKALWLVAAGIASALAISTKLSGIFGIISTISLYWYVSQNRKPQKLAWLNYGILLAPTAIISVILNDPASYLNGITQPADQEFQVTGYQYWLQGSGILLRQIMLISTSLIGPVLMAGLVWSLFYLGRHIRKNFTIKFLAIWLLGLIPFLWLQPESEYAWLPIMPVLSLLVAYVAHAQAKKNFLIISLALFLLTLPFTIIYGLRFSKLPYIRKNHSYNRTIHDNFFQTVLTKVNQTAPPNAVVVFLPQQEYPFFMLRSDISWSYYEKADNVDMYVMEPTAPVPPGFQLIETLSGKEDEQDLLRKIYESN